MNSNSNMVFLNRSFDKKRLKALLLWFRLNLSEGAALKAVETLQELGFRSATQGAISLGLDDLKTPVSKGGRVFQAQLEVALAYHEHHRGNRTPVELFQHLVDTWHRTSQDLTSEVVQLFHSTERVNPVYMMAFSGARGNISQVRQLVGMRGLMADPRGQIVGFPILSNFREGLTITEYFVSCYGARKGVVDTAIRTADAGYLTRRLADVSHHVVVRNTNCGTHRNVLLRDIKEGKKTILSLANRLIGRVLAEHISKSPKELAYRNDEITPDLASKLASQHFQVPVRSPLCCSLRWGVCQLCYGWGLSEGRRVTLGEAVGIIAAQSIGEPGTQLTLRTFHTGGVFSGDLLNEIRAPYTGMVFFPEPLQGLLVRTAHGQIAFLTKVLGKMVVSATYSHPTDVKKVTSCNVVNEYGIDNNFFGSFLSRALLVSSGQTTGTAKGKTKDDKTFQSSSQGLKKIGELEFINETYNALIPKIFIKLLDIIKIPNNEFLTPVRSKQLEEKPVKHQKYKKTKGIRAKQEVDCAEGKSLNLLNLNSVGNSTESIDFILQPSTVIFVRQKEQIYQNQLLAEFSSSNLQSTNDQIEITQQILSETAGQVWFKEISYGNRKGPGSGSLGTHFSSQNLGGVWVLAGKPESEMMLNDRRLFPYFGGASSFVSDEQSTQTLGETEAEHPKSSLFSFSNPPLPPISLGYKPFLENQNSLSDKKRLLPGNFLLSPKNLSSSFVSSAFSLKETEARKGQSTQGETRYASKMQSTGQSTITTFSGKKRGSTFNVVPYKQNKKRRSETWLRTKKKTGTTFLNKINQNVLGHSRLFTESCLQKNFAQHDQSRNYKNFPVKLHNDYYFFKYNYSLGYSQLVYWSDFVSNKRDVVTLGEHVSLISLKNFDKTHIHFKIKDQFCLNNVKNYLDWRPCFTPNKRVRGIFFFPHSHIQCPTVFGFHLGKKNNTFQFSTLSSSMIRDCAWCMVHLRCKDAKMQKQRSSERFIYGFRRASYRYSDHSLKNFLVNIGQRYADTCKNKLISFTLSDILKDAFTFYKTTFQGDKVEKAHLLLGAPVSKKSSTKISTAWLLPKVWKTVPSILLEEPLFYNKEKNQGQFFFLVNNITPYLKKQGGFRSFINKTDTSYFLRKKCKSEMSMLLTISWSNVAQNFQIKTLSGFPSRSMGEGSRLENPILTYESRKGSEAQITPSDKNWNQLESYFRCGGAFINLPSPTMHLRCKGTHVSYSQVILNHIELLLSSSFFILRFFALLASPCKHLKRPKHAKRHIKKLSTKVAYLPRIALNEEKKLNQFRVHYPLALLFGKPKSQGVMVVTRLMQALDLNGRKCSVTNRGIFSPLQQNYTFENFTTLMCEQYFVTRNYLNEQGCIFPASVFQFSSLSVYPSAKLALGEKSQQKGKLEGNGFSLPYRNGGRKGTPFTTCANKKLHRTDMVRSFKGLGFEKGSKESSQTITSEYEIARRKIKKLIVINPFWQALSLTNYPSQIRSYTGINHVKSKGKVSLITPVNKDKDFLKGESSTCNKIGSSFEKNANTSLLTGPTLRCLEVTSLGSAGFPLPCPQGKKHEKKENSFLAAERSRRYASKMQRKQPNLDCVLASQRKEDAPPLEYIYTLPKHDKKKGSNKTISVCKPVLLSVHISNATLSFVSEKILSVNKIWQTRNLVQIGAKKKQIEQNDGSLDQHIVHTVHLPIVPFPYVIQSDGKYYRGTALSKNQKMNFGGNNKMVSIPTYYHSNCGTPVQGNLLPLLRQSLWEENCCHKNLDHTKDLLSFSRREKTNGRKGKKKLVQFMHSSPPFIESDKRTFSCILCTEGTKAKAAQALCPTLYTPGAKETDKVPVFGCFASEANHPKHAEQKDNKGKKSSYLTKNSLGGSSILFDSKERRFGIVPSFLLHPLLRTQKGPSFTLEENRGKRETGTRSRISTWQGLQNRAYITQCTDNISSNLNSLLLKRLEYLSKGRFLRCTNFFSENIPNFGLISESQEFILSFYGIQILIPKSFTLSVSISSENRSFFISDLRVSDMHFVTSLPIRTIINPHGRYTSSCLQFPKNSAIAFISTSTKQSLNLNPVSFSLSDFPKKSKTLRTGKFLYTPFLKKNKNTNLTYLTTFNPNYRPCKANKAKTKSLEEIPYTNCFSFMRRIREYPLESCTLNPSIRNKRKKLKYSPLSNINGVTDLPNVFIGILLFNSPGIRELFDNFFSFFAPTLQSTHIPLLSSEKREAGLDDLEEIGAKQEVEKTKEREAIGHRKVKALQNKPVHLLCTRTPSLTKENIDTRGVNNLLPIRNTILGSSKKFLYLNKSIYLNWYTCAFFCHSISIFSAPKVQRERPKDEFLSTLLTDDLFITPPFFLAPVSKKDKFKFEEPLLRLLQILCYSKKPILVECTSFAPTLRASKMQSTHTHSQASRELSPTYKALRQKGSKIDKEYTDVLQLAKLRKHNTNLLKPLLSEFDQVTFSSDNRVDQHFELSQLRAQQENVPLAAHAKQSIWQSSLNSKSVTTLDLKKGVTTNGEFIEFIEGNRENPPSLGYFGCFAGEAQHPQHPNQKRRGNREFRNKITQVSNTFNVFPGQLIAYGETIANNIVTTESGQVLYIDSQKITLRKAQTVLIYSQAILSVLSGDWIKKGTPLMALSYQKLVTGDIVQGLPKIEQFFEAPVLRDGTFWSDSLQAKLNQFFQEHREQLPLAEAVREGFSQIQRVLVEGVQRVYISQGVLIADKHLEVIVRQMTCKGRIIYSGDTGFLRNELVSLDKIESVNQVTYGQKALYHPQVRGITDASLESESFLSAASFQETTRVLSRDAIIGKTDLMRGLKERVIVGELIQAGTGLANNNVYHFLQ